MAHTFITAGAVLREAIKEFKNNLSAVNNCRKIVKKDFEIGGLKGGSSVSVTVPPLFTTRSGATFSGQDLTEKSVTVSLDQQTGIDINGLTSQEMTMNLQDFSSQFVKPAMNILAAKVEAYLLNKIYLETYNRVGTAGTTPNSALVALQAKQKLLEAACPGNDCSLHISPAANVAMVDALKGLFNPQASLGSQYKKGMMAADTLGWDWYVNQAVPTHVNGTGTLTTNALTATVSTQGATQIAVNGLTGSGTVKAGTTFTVANVFQVNPLTKASTGQLQIFTVTADATASTGAATLDVSPAMYTTGAYQNIDAFPQTGATATFYGAASTSYVQNLGWYKDAVAFVNVQVEKPQGVDFAASESFDGIAMRVVRNFDISNDKFPLRFDVYYGAKVLRPEWCVRMSA